MSKKKLKIKSRRRARKLQDKAWKAAADGNLDLARKGLRRALDDCQDNPEIWNDYGLILHQSGDFEEAEKALRNAILIAPTYTEAYANLADLVSRLGRTIQAERLQRRAVKLAPGDRIFREQLEAYRALLPQPEDTVVPEPEHIDSDEATDQALRLDRYDWADVESELTGRGCALLDRLLTAEECRAPGALRRTPRLPTRPSRYGPPECWRTIRPRCPVPRLQSGTPELIDLNQPEARMGLRLFSIWSTSPSLQIDKRNSALFIYEGRRTTSRSDQGGRDARLSEMQTETEPQFARGSEISEEEFFRHTHEDSDWQYLGGRPVMAAAASNRHEDLFSFLLTLLRVFLDEGRGGAVRGSRYPMRLDSMWSPEPDLLVIDERKLSKLTKLGLDGPADLVIEIASETDPDFDLRERLPRYLAAEIPEIWLIDPFESSIRVDVWAPAGYTTRELTSGRLESSAIRGFWIEVDWLWQDELPSTFKCLQKLLP